MPGRQCSTENKEHGQHTRLVAGGQRMSQRNFVPSDFIQFCTLGTAALAQLGCTALQHTPYLMGCEPVAHTLLLHTSLGVVQTSPLRSPVLVSSNIGYGTYTKNAGRTPELALAQPSGSSLDFLRWRRLISLSKAATTNCPVLSPSCFNNSTSSAMWCGTRTSNLFDFAFTDLVAIARFLNSWCPTIISKKKMNAILDVSDTLALVCVRHLMFSMVPKKTTPRTVRAVPRRLTKPLYEVTTMAELQSTQTRPEFTWLFLATPKHYPECAPVVIRFDADTESSARAAFPGWELVFAAKIRAQAPCRVSFFDYSTRRGWEFDSAASQEVHHG